MKLCKVVAIHAVAVGALIYGFYRVNRHFKRNCDCAKREVVE